MEFRIFVSYSTLDLTQVELLRSQLSNTPIDLFIAEHSVTAGANLSETIKSSISCCDLFVVVWSKNAKESGWVSQEIGQALALQKPILPLVLDKEHPPSGFVSNIKYIPMYEGVPQALHKAEEIIMRAYENKHERMQAERKRKESDDMAKLGVAAFLLWLGTRG